MLHTKDPRPAVPPHTSAAGRGTSFWLLPEPDLPYPATVKTHVSRVLAKLDLNNRVQVALLAYDAGLLEEPEGDGH